MEATIPPPASMTKPTDLYRIYITNEHWKGMNPYGMDKIIRKLEYYFCGTGPYKNQARMNRIEEVKAGIEEKKKKMSSVQRHIFKAVAYDTEV